MDIPRSIRKLASDHSRRLQWMREQSREIYEQYQRGDISARDLLQKQDELLQVRSCWLKRIRF